MGTIILFLKSSRTSPFIKMHIIWKFLAMPFELTMIISSGGMLSIPGAFYSFRFFSAVRNYDFKIFPLLLCMSTFSSSLTDEILVLSLHIIFINIIQQCALSAFFKMYFPSLSIRLLLLPCDYQRCFLLHYIYFANLYVADG